MDKKQTRAIKIKDGLIYWMQVFQQHCIFSNRKNWIPFLDHYQERARYYSEEKPMFKLTYSINGVEKWVWADREPITQTTLTALLRRHNDKTKDSI
jgi:hypothetical protein